MYLQNLPIVPPWSQLARPPLMTAASWQVLLLLAAEVGPALSDSTGKVDPDPQALRSEQAFLGWAWHSFDVDIPRCLQLGLVPLLLLSSLSCWLQLGSKATAPGNTRKTRLIISAMALFTLTSLLLLTALQPRWASGTAGMTGGATATADKPVFTLPSSADVGMKLLPNIIDPEAVDPQTVCPGYIASNVHDTGSSVTADLTLAGPACNVYGNDVEHLTLSVEYQAEDRVHVEIRPRYVGPQNETWFLLPEVIVPRPANDGQQQSSTSSSQLAVSWSNEPTFSFSVKRKDTGDTLFSTQGTVLVYEDQLIEFISPLPENYNLYGLGEVVRGFRLGNNLTSEFTA